MKIVALNNESGLTIVELLIALLITAFLATIMVGFSIDKLAQGNLETDRYELLTNAETGLDTVSNDVRVAYAADDTNSYQDPNSPGAPSNELSWESGSTTLVLSTAAQNSDGQILFQDPSDYVAYKNNIIYFLSGSTLYRRVLADPVTGNAAVTTCPASDATASCPADSPILSNVESFSIQYYNSDNQEVDPSDARSVQLSVELLENKYGQNISASYTTRMVFRNV